MRSGYCAGHLRVIGKAERSFMGGLQERSGDDKLRFGAASIYLRRHGPVAKGHESRSFIGHGTREIVRIEWPAPSYELQDALPQFLGGALGIDIGEAEQQG